MPKIAAKCKHPRVDTNLHCKTCGAKVDIREKRNKYGAVKKYGFHSVKEEKRFRCLVTDPTVFNLRCQEEWPLVVSGVLICKYRSDFSYLRSGEDKVMREVVEDVKGYKKGAAYRIFTIKKNLMKACKGIDVVEV